MPQAQPFVLLITGPAGAGKSTAAAAWAARQTSPTAHISLDDVREFMVAGYADPRDGWIRKPSGSMILRDVIAPTSRGAS